MATMYVSTIEDMLTGIYETPLQCFNTVREVVASGKRLAMSSQNPAALKDYDLVIVGTFQTDDGYITDSIVEDSQAYGDHIRWNLYDLYKQMVGDVENED